MKKKILLFVLAFAMMFTSLVNVAFADESGDGEGTGVVCDCPVHNPDYVAPSSACDGASRLVNIASQAIKTTTLTADIHWALRDNLGYLVDGDWHMGTLSSPRTPTNNFTMDFGTEDPKTVDKIVIVVNSFGKGSNNLTYATMTTRNFELRVDIWTWDEVNQVEVKQDRQTFNTLSEIQSVTLEPNAPVTKIYVEYFLQAYTNDNVIWEVEVWSTDVHHIWELDNTDTAPTCTEDGVGDYVCACGATNDDQPIPATGHTAGTEWFIEPAVPEVPAVPYDPPVEDDPATEVDESIQTPAIPAVPEKHYNVCANGDCTEKMNVGEHVYSTDCDLTCNTCAATREATGTHSYYEDCSTKCDNCGFVRTDAPAQHTYDHSCDDTCNVCEEGRTVVHTYTDCADTTCNIVIDATEGTLCPATREAGVCVFDNACDADCNVCGAANPDCDGEHAYDNCDDTDCNDCGATRTALVHVYDNCEDTGCNTCGMTRTAVAHVYDNACDASCANCTLTRTPADHVYDNACDASCNVCGGTRTPADHVYDNACDKTCNVCNAERTVADHVYGEWAENEEGYNERACTICGVKETGEKAGLSGGAIAGIVVGSVAVVGGGGFAAWWFIFKKKAI